MQEGGAGTPRSRRRRVAFAFAIAAAGFLLGLAAGVFLWPPPSAPPGEMIWPVHVSVDFSAAPANASLQFSLAIVRDNATLGRTDYTVGHPASGTPNPMFTTTQTLQAVPQTLQVVSTLSLGGTSTFNISVRPGSFHATPIPSFLIHYNPPLSSPIGSASGWTVSLQFAG